MMKIIALIGFALIMGCTEDQEKNIAGSEWDIVWEMDDQQINGELTLFKDHHARLNVFGDAGSLLVQDTSTSNYLWEFKAHELTLKRLDNQIELRYEILSQSPNFIELSFADEITVKLRRTTGLANI